MSLKHNDPAGAHPGAGPHGLIQHYESIAQASRTMLEAAQQGDWARVEQIESRCREMIAALKQAARTDGLSESEKTRRVALLRGILKDDAQIRVRAEPWLRDLEDYLSTARNAGPTTR